MKLVSDDYKSIPAFEKEDLPSFVVLTGLNGSGKTHLLEGLANGQIRFHYDSGNAIQDGRYFNYQTIGQSEPVKSTPVSTLVQQDNFVAHLVNDYPLYLAELDNPSLGVRVPLQTGKRYNNDKIVLTTTLKAVAEFTKKDIRQLQKEDFVQYKIHRPLGLNSGDVFFRNLADIFKTYQDAFETNRYNQYLTEKFSEQNKPFISDEKFKEINGPGPWVVVNEILQVTQLNYEVNSPEGYQLGQPFELVFTNKVSGIPVKLEELSSGERILMSLVFALYGFHYMASFPKLLLLDELDAPLHPSMSKYFLRVIKEVLVKQHGIAVFIATHSVTTVALAPEESIYIVNNTMDPATKLKKVSKDKALGRLTIDVPSLSINYKNRRQIFVESENDEKFYEKMYTALSNRLNLEISLNFIASGTVKMDKNGMRVNTCDQVKEATKILRNGGNTSVWGIIDWDLTNQETDYVKVLGYNARYNIENFLIDPVLVGLLLLREVRVTAKQMGLPQETNYMDLVRHPTQQELQTVSNFVVSGVKPLIKPITSSEVEVQLVDGIKIMIPTWYLHLPGHKLENKAIEAFPQLNEFKGSNEQGLKLKILSLVVGDNPGLLAKEILQLLRSLQVL